MMAAPTQSRRFVVLVEGEPGTPTARWWSGWPQPYGEIEKTQSFSLARSWPSHETAEAASLAIGGGKIQSYMEHRRDRKI